MIELLLLFFIFSSALFSGMEIGLISLSPLRLQILSKKFPKKVSKIVHFRSDWNRFLSVMLIGNDISVVSASALFTLVSYERLHIKDDLIISLLFSFIMLLFAEAGPKILFRYYKERLVLICMPWLNLVSIILYPITSIFTYLAKLIIGCPETDDKQHIASREELKLLLYQRASLTQLDYQERSLMKQILEFSSKQVSSIMTPIDEVVFVRVDMQKADVLSIARRKGFSRYPVVDGERVVGFVHILELLTISDEESWTDYIRPIIYVYEKMSVAQLFYQMQVVRANMVVVYGDDFRPIGIITMKDVMDEIVGDVR